MILLVYHTTGRTLCGCVVYGTTVLPVLPLPYSVHHGVLVERYSGVSTPGPSMDPSMVVISRRPLLAIHSHHLHLMQLVVVLVVV